MANVRTLYLIGAISSVACCASAQSDFDEYVASIRKSGMSEDAAGAATMVAGILSGDSTFKATLAPDGSVGHSYSSNMCFVRTSDPKLREKQRALRATQAAKRDLWIAFLKVQADDNRSGFLNSTEGAALRRRVETALVAVQLNLHSIDELAKAVGDEPAEVRADLAAYTRLRAEAAAQRLEGMPPLPTSLDDTPR